MKIRGTSESRLANKAQEMMERYPNHPKIGHITGHLKYLEKQKKKKQA